MSTYAGVPLWRIASWLAAERGSEEVVSTTLSFPADPEAVWASIVTYEEVKRPAPLWLRLLLPQPVGTKGDKTQPGAAIPCLYRGGHLTKRIRTVEAPYYLSFDVTDQHLGIERFLMARRGSYEISPAGEHGSVVELVTCYEGRLRPRWLWRPIEAAIAHAFHRHVLAGMREEVAQCSTSACRISSSASLR